MLSARNTTVQLLTLYTNPEHHNAQHYNRMDRQTGRQTDKRHHDAKSRSYCIILIG